MIRTIHFEDTAVPAINKFAGFIALLKMNREAAEARRNAPVIAPEILKAEYLLKQIQGQSFLFSRYGRHHSAVLNSATSLVQIETDRLPSLTTEQMVEFENLYPVPQSVPEGKPLPALTGPVCLTTLGEGRSSEKSFKSLAQDADTAHKEYLADKLCLSDFMDIAYELLEHNSATDSVVEFLASIHHELEDKKFGLGQKFSNALMHAYKAHGANQGITTTEDSQQQHLEDAGEEIEASADVVTSASAISAQTTRSGKTRNYESLVQEKLIDRLNGAYACYCVAANEISVKELFDAISKFSLVKIKNQTWDASASGGATQEDATQDVAMQVWTSLDKFLGEPNQFHSWVSTMAHSAGIRLFNESIEDKNKFAPLFVKTEDGSVEDNPAIYHEARPEYQKELPQWIQGTDRWICDLIREDMTYAEIGKFLHITEANVKTRVFRMKARILSEKKAYLEARNAL